MFQSFLKTFRGLLKLRAIFSQTRTQSLFMCFRGERRLGVRLRRARSHGKVRRNNALIYLSSSFQIVVSEVGNNYLLL